MKDLLKNEKNNKLIRKGDIFVYIALFILIIIVFLSVFFTKSNQEYNKVYITVSSEKCAEYDFLKDNLTIYTDTVTYVKENNTYEIFIQNGNNYNTIFIDISKNTVEMTDSNCIHKDCICMKITKKGDSIICEPNNVIVTTEQTDISEPTIG